MSRLSIYRDDGLVDEHVLMRASVRLGRHPENDIVLDDLTLSRFHARLERRGARYVVLDMNAQNGVFLNGVRVTGEQELSPGDRITLGAYVAIFDQPNAPGRARGAGRIGDGAESEDPLIDALEGADKTLSTPGDAPSSMDLESYSVGDDIIIDDAFEDPTTSLVRGAKRSPQLVLLYNGLEVSRHDVDRDLIIGRSKTSDVVISLLGLSRRHARISRDGGEVSVEDLDSQNGTWVNNQRIEGARVLRQGDLINFYEYAILFLEDKNAQISFPGAGFDAVDDDELSIRETGRRAPPSAELIEAAKQVPTNRSPVPIADSLEGAPASEADVSLGEGSFLGDAFDQSGEELQVSATPPEGTDVVDGFSSSIGSTNADIDSRLMEELERLQDTGALGEGELDKTMSSVRPRVGDGTERGPWPSDEALEQGLARVANPSTATLEVFLDGRPYTQMPLSKQVTRIGTDARCELALPNAAGLAKWQLTLVHFGAAVILYRASANARVRIDDVDVDQAVLKDGDKIQLGRVQITLKLR